MIRGSSINQDGRSSGLTAPNGLAQQAVVRRALAAAAMRPAEVSYVEAHGTGTSLGDPIEIEALATVYGEGRSADEPLAIGSVKSNIGHLEAAAGVMGLCKVVLALQHRQIPASLHVRQPTRAIDWDAIPVRVATELRDWQPASGRRIAGVSAFGFSGMNAHLLLAEAPVTTGALAGGRSIDAAAGADTTHSCADRLRRPMQVLPLSARSTAALAAVVERHAAHLELHAEQDLEAICRTASTGRSHLSHRLAFVARDRRELRDQLAACRDGRDGAIQGQVPAGAAPRVAFLFSGQGSQYVGMGGELHEAEPVFREVFDRCARVLDPLLGQSLHELVFDGSDDVLARTGCTQPALYALQVALAALWRSWGIEPAAVIGHSVGEFAAAAVAGVLEIEDGARLVCARGRLMQALPAGGSMFAVQGDPLAIERAVAAHAARVAIAARNAPSSLVISGCGEETAAVAGRLAEVGMRVTPLIVSHAFHSPLMEPMVAEFMRFAATIAHRPPRINWISNLTGEPFRWDVHGEAMSAYWGRHVREPVAFAAGMRTLGASGCRTFLEIGPHPVLVGLGALCLGDAAEAAWLPSLKRGQPQVAQMVDSAARLYVRGAPLDWAAFNGPGREPPLRLPTYPFQRGRFLVPPLDPARRSPGQIVHALLGERLPMAGGASYFERRLSAADPAWIADHRIGADVVMPMTGYLEMGLAACREMGSAAGSAGDFAIDELEVHEAMVFHGNEERVQQVVACPQDDGRLRLEIFSRPAAADAAWTLHASAWMASGGDCEAAGYEVLSPSAGEPVDSGDFYQRLQSLGVQFGPAFQGMKQLRVGSPGEAAGDVALTAAVVADGDRYLLHPALLDACLHAASTAMQSLPGPADDRIYLPIGLDRYRRLASPQGPLLSHARVRGPAVRGELVVLDLRISTADGTPVALLSGLRCRRVGRDAFRQRLEAKAAEMLYETVWQERAVTAPVAATAAGSWLILDDGTGRGAALAREIRRRDGTAMLVAPAAADGQHDGAAEMRTDALSVAASDAPVADPIAAPGDDGGARRLVIRAERQDDYRRLLAHAGQGPALKGIVDLWPLRLQPLSAQDLPGRQQRDGSAALLLLLQALADGGAAAAAPLWVVTQGAQNVDGSSDICLEQAPVSGLAKVAAVEHPEFRVVQVDLDPQVIRNEAASLLDELLAGDGEPQVAFRKGSRYVARLARKRPAPARDIDCEPMRLAIETRGTLENLAVCPMTRRPPNPGEVEIRVRASGLNFRDVLSALGMYPGEIRNLGSDCAGEVVAIGEGVSGFAIGDRVVAMAEGSFASHATTRVEFVAPLPGGLDFEQGAAIPTAYLTADITLNRIAAMKRGDRVLIHSGAGGVGMAAVALARRAGAEVFATAGSAEKRDFLDQLGVEHVFDSRSARFADEILRLTGGAGVDIILNSLTGEMLDRSFEVLGKGGVFLEIGKRNLWTHQQVEALGKGIRYHIVDCNDHARDTPHIVGEIFTRVLRDIASGELPVLPCTTFAFEQAAAAFRYMAQARHIGRVVFRHSARQAQPDKPVSPQSTYLVTGGLGGLGLVSAKWLAAEGARHLLLAARSEPDEQARATLGELAAAGVQVAVVPADVATADGVAKVMARLALDMPPLGGVLHCAGILDDGVLCKQTPERLAAVMGPKADGAWLIHQALLAHGHRPGFFVLFSSMSSVFGAAGQGNYVAANAFLDALARHRRHHGQTCISINWGAWKDVGMAARGNTLARAGADGLGAIAPSDGMLVLGLLLRDAAPQAAVSPIDWPRLVARLDGARPPPLLQDLAAAEQARHAPQPAAASPARERIDLSQLDPAQRRERLAALVRQELATVLALGSAAAAIEDDASFTSLGLDSLTAVELRNRLQRTLGCSVPATAAFEWPSVSAFSAGLAGLHGEAAMNGTGQGGEVSAGGAGAEGAEGEREEMVL